MIGKLFAGFALVEGVALAAVAVIATAPEFVEARKSFLQKAENLIEDRTARAGSVDSALNATALRALKSLRRKASDGWGFDDVAGLELVVSRMTLPFAKEVLEGGIETTAGLTSKANTYVQNLFDGIVNWPKQEKAA